MSTMKVSERFAFIVPQSRGRKTFALVCAMLCFGLLALMCWKIAHGSGLTFFQKQPGGAAVMLIVLAGIAVFIKLAFPPVGAFGQLQFRGTNIAFTPARASRWLGAEPISASIPPDAQEILFRCRPGRYCLLIQTADGREYDTGIALLTQLNASAGSELLEGIPAATGLAARIVTSYRTANGQIEDRPWRPRSIAAKWGTVGKLVVSSVPFWASAIVGYLTTSLTTIAVVGVALWFAQTLALMAYARFGAKRTGFPWLYWASTLVTFGAAYFAIAVWVCFEVHPR
jgi:hypothetical protein